jgi:hypothetical protein
MAFINELIPKEEKLKFAFEVYTCADGTKPTLWKWTIDRERRAYLVITHVWGGGYEGTQTTEHYILCWEDNLIRFQCSQQSSGSISIGQSLTLRVHNLVVPVQLKDKVSEIQRLIIDALDAKDWPYRRSAYVSVNIIFCTNVSVGG